MIRHRLLKRLAAARDGVVLVEFAFMAPLLLLLILGGLEMANYALANMRVNQMAISVADNAGRVRTSVDEPDIQEVFSAADLLGNRLDFKDNGRVVLSSLRDNGQRGRDAGQEIAWQRCWGELDVAPAYGVEGDGSDDDRFEDGIGEDGKKVRSLRNATMMFVEVTYEYQPLVGPNWFSVNPMRAEAAFNVRSLRSEAITNTQGLEVHDCD